MIHGLSGSGLCNVFKLMPSRTRGGSSKILLSQPKTTLRAKSFSFRAGSHYLILSKKVPIFGSI
uniref:Ovule protein n=1 Tax=Haemonchus contortus TaxID=6289 RepID=A0A7I4XUE6_HAECO